MNTTISSLRLVNRAFIKINTDVDIPRLSNLFQLIEIAEKYGIFIRCGTEGIEQAGPFLEAVYKSPETILNAENLFKFIDESSGFFDMYNGIMPYTMLELDLSYVINRGEHDYSGKTQFVVYYDYETDTVIKKAFDKKESPILHIKPRVQHRLTALDISSAIKQKNIFINPRRADETNRQADDPGELEGEGSEQQELPDSAGLNTSYCASVCE